MMRCYSNKELRVRNGMEEPEVYDRASFESDGGEEGMIENPGDVDETLWKKAKEISMKSYGEMRYPFISYMYEKLGGQFHRKK